MAVGRQALEAVSNSGSSLSNGHTQRLITCIRFLLGKDKGENLPSLRLQLSLLIYTDFWIWP